MDGEMLGPTDGELLGLTDGEMLGLIDGETLGLMEGETLGPPEGDALGLPEGDPDVDGEGDGPVQMGSVIEFVSRVTAAVRARARPSRFAPVFIVIEAWAMMLPMKSVPVPSVADDPICQ